MDNKGVDAMYVNVLINLQENIPTYGVNGKKVTGHVMVTSPGVIKCYVENLNQSGNRRFALYAFSNKDSKGTKIGNLSEEKMTKWIVDEKNVKESGIKLEDIDAIAITLQGEGMRGVDAVLVGFKENRYMIMPILEELVPRVIKPVVPEECQKKSILSTESQLEQVNSLSVQKEIELDRPEDTGEEEEGEGELDRPENLTLQEEEDIELLEGPNDITVPTVLPSDTTSEKNTGKLESERLKVAVESVISEATVVVPKDKEKIDERSSSEEKDLKELVEALMAQTQVMEREVGKGISGDTDVEESISKKEGTTRKERSQKSTFQKALEAKYMKQQVYRSERDDQYTQESESRETVELIDTLLESEKEREEENGEETDYLVEIEKRLKDIQARLKAAEIGKSKDLDVEVENDTISASSGDNENVSVLREGNTLRIPLEEEEEEVDDLNTSSKMDVVQKLINHLKRSTSNVPLGEEVNRSEHKKETNSKEKGEIEEIFNSGEYVEKFLQEDEEHEWVRISYTDFLKMPSLSYEWCMQPFITFAYYKYNEILLGRAEGTDQYYIGIPDVYYPGRSEHLNSEKKIKKFLCRRNVEPNSGEYGYWVVEV